MSGEDHWQTRQSRTNVFWSLRHTSGPGGAGSWTVQIQYTIYLGKHKYCGCIVAHSFLSSSRPLPVFFLTSSCLLPVFFLSSSRILSVLFPSYRVGTDKWNNVGAYIWNNLCSRHHFSVTNGLLDIIHLCFNPRKVNFSDYGWARGAVYKDTKISAT